jgi:hypothetical protein
MSAAEKVSSLRKLVRPDFGPTEIRRPQTVLQAETFSAADGL